MRNSQVGRGIQKAGTPDQNPMTAIRHRGYSDAALGNDFPAEYEDGTWGRNRQINYERGRHQWAIAAAATNGNAPVWKKTALLTTIFDAAVPGGSALLRQTKVSAAPYVDR